MFINLGYSGQKVWVLMRLSPTLPNSKATLSGYIHRIVPQHVTNSVLIRQYKVIQYIDDEPSWHTHNRY